MDSELRTRLDLLVFLLFVCASFLGTIAVGVTGPKALGTSMFFFGVWGVFTFFLVQWREIRGEDDTNTEDAKPE
ncbi:hypothetical protein V5735_16720 (plasmid) [Haladaptatus sp. SPP-AMP-3]|uniref:hypothetical protein n=1 Tax=Haladaptatus sp. SPP-AMP-3 TaxID=3121295 RepID=UPI003C2C35A6